ncbi:glutamyl-tRNA reductase [Aeromicrobium panaciterrae]|uniref:Glutamyl-tRNA reductase n=1 Tax=Aeromicrobium panaciterrae TaxID=363861 RepID=A0ABU1URV0_9ACTN|nr:glutamyl-tRNA reductase [Aeromicrobium panaciterrae]MDR7087901.1 glutamyl-tRNA reductase [Aeromicrobium panaciterrae]
MSVLVVGMSHKSAPLEVLEKVALDPTASIKLSQLVLETPFVTESVVVSTCNRVEIYVEAERFHGAVEEVSRLLAEHADLGRDEFVRHVYVHFDEAAVAHIFGVAAGMDSMILGESQILGQVRDALLTAQTESTVGPALNALFQQALRIGKRGHAETGIDRLAPSIVTASFAAAGDIVDARDTRFLIAGAGTMAKLAVRTLVDRGVDADQIAVANRTYERAQDLSIESGVRAVRWEDLDDELAAADVLISCTGANGVVFDRPRIEAAGRPQVLIDLALPRDIDGGVRDIDGVSLIDLVVLSKLTENAELAADVKQVRSIVEDEVRTFLVAKAASQVTPTVVALRTMATDVVDAEVARIEARLPNLTADELASVRQALRRVADKLIHTPTVRVQQLVDGTGSLTYAEALADLFALDQAAVDAVTRVGGEQA